MKHDPILTQRQQWRLAQPALSRQQLRALRQAWLARSDTLPLPVNARRLQWLRLRCSLLLTAQRF